MYITYTMTATALCIRIITQSWNKSPAVARVADRYAWFFGCYGPVGHSENAADCVKWFDHKSYYKFW